MEAKRMKELIKAYSSAGGKGRSPPLILEEHLHCGSRRNYKERQRTTKKKECTHAFKTSQIARKKVTWNRIHKETKDLSRNQWVKQFWIKTSLVSSNLLMKGIHTNKNHKVQALLRTESVKILFRAIIEPQFSLNVFFTNSDKWIAKYMHISTYYLCS